MPCGAREVTIASTDSASDAAKNDVVNHSVAWRTRT
jgi:hypothetical protein